MGNETKNYKFPKPGVDDFYDIAENNKAMDILDETLTVIESKKLDKDGDISGTKIDLIETITSEFPVPDAGETPKVFLGKVRKFIQDFNNFKTGIITVGKLVNNGQTTAAGYALDARYGKTLYDMYGQLNSDLNKFVLENAARVRFGVTATSMYIDVYGSPTTFYRIELSVTEEKIYLKQYDGSSLTTVFSK